MALRALHKGLVKMEKARLPKPSPFVLLYGSFDAWVEQYVLPDIEAGKLDRRSLPRCALGRQTAHGTARMLADGNLLN